MTGPARTTAGPAPARTGGTRRKVLPDLVVIVVWFVVLGVLGAVAWWLLVDLPNVTVLQGKQVLIGADLERQVSIDGWYAVIALVGGLASGLVLTTWRDRDPVLTVAASTLASGLTAVLMLELGKLLGPGSPKVALTGQPDGATAPLQLVPHAPGVGWLWPAAVALGCLLQLWSFSKTDEKHADPDSPR